VVWIDLNRASHCRQAYEACGNERPMAHRPKTSSELRAGYPHQRLPQTVSRAGCPPSRADVASQPIDNQRPDPPNCLVQPVRFWYAWKWSGARVRDGPNGCGALGNRA
jgi:hypothetical protein